MQVRNMRYKIVLIALCVVFLSGVSYTDDWYEIQEASSIGTDYTVAGSVAAAEASTSAEYEPKYSDQELKTSMQVAMQGMVERELSREMSVTVASSTAGAITASNVVTGAKDDIGIDTVGAIRSRGP